MRDDSFGFVTQSRSAQRPRQEDSEFERHKSMIFGAKPCCGGTLLLKLASRPKAYLYSLNVCLLCNPKLLGGEFRMNDIAWGWSGRETPVKFSTEATRTTTTHRREHLVHHYMV